MNVDMKVTPKLTQAHRAYVLVAALIMFGAAVYSGYWAWQVLSWKAVVFAGYTAGAALYLLCGGVLLFVATSDD